MIGIIIKNYEHYNRSLNKYIRNKRQYIDECKRGGFVPLEQAEEISKKAKEKQEDYQISKKAKEIIMSAKSSADRKGRLKPSDRLLDGMKEVGVKFTVPDWCPKHYREGGFV